MNFDLTEEQKLWREAVHAFVAKELKPKAAEVDEKAEFNAAAVKKMGPLGLLGLNVPEEFGGAEPGAGSDLKGGVQTKAEQEGDEWVITGEKMWCTNASIADFIVTLVRTAKGAGSDSLSLIVVPTDAKGLSIGPAEKKMGLKGSPTHAGAYQAVRVPAANLV